MPLSPISNQNEGALARQQQPTGAPQEGAKELTREQEGPAQEGKRSVIAKLLAAPYFLWFCLHSETMMVPPWAQIFCIT